MCSSQCHTATVLEVRPLRFADGTPVRAASALVRYLDGWLVAQDDATSGAWLRDGSVEALRLLPPVAGHDSFSSAEATKHLKPDLESACALPGGAVLLLGSGSTPARTRAVLLEPDGTTTVADLAPAYAAVAAALEVPGDRLNLEGACPLGDRLRWFQRGLPAAGVPTAYVDVDLATVLAAVRGGDARAVAVLDRGFPALPDDLAVTDAVPLPEVAGGPPGAVLVSAAAEDSPSTYDDGEVTASALAVLDGAEVAGVWSVPAVEGLVAKVEGLAVVSWDRSSGTVLACVDADDTDVPSLLLTLELPGASS